ncbi:MAG: hypothetical protein V8Q54_09775 [Alistipes senegalensis]
MKSLLLSCLLIAGLSSACSPGVSNSAVSARYAERDSLLTALDRTVANKAVYIGLRHGRIDSLEAEFARESDPERKLKIGQAIFRLYFDFQNDLALEHLEEMQTLAAEIADTRPDYLQIIRLKSSVAAAIYGTSERILRTAGRGGAFSGFAGGLSLLSHGADEELRLFVQQFAFRVQGIL